PLPGRPRGRLRLTRRSWSGPDEPAGVARQRDRRPTDATPRAAIALPAGARAGVAGVASARTAIASATPREILIVDPTRERAHGLEIRGNTRCDPSVVMATCLGRHLVVDPAPLRGARIAVSNRG